MQTCFRRTIISRKESQQSSEKSKMNKIASPEAGPSSGISPGSEAEGFDSTCKKCGSNIFLQLLRNKKQSLHAAVPEKQNIDTAVVDLISSLLETPLSSRTDPEQCHIVLCLGRPLNHQNKEAETWFSEYKWLCGSSNLQKLFCWPCVLVGTEKNVWCESGFDDFPNITESARTHEESRDHIENSLQFLELEVDLEDEFSETTSEDKEENASNPKITTYEENIKQNRRLMQMIIDTVLCAVEQEIMCSKRVMKCLLELIVGFGPKDVVDRFEQFKRLFPGDVTNVQDELVEYINEYIQEYVLNELQATDMFAVRLDSTSHAVIVRFVNANGQLVERFLGFQTCDLPGAWGIYRLLETALEPFDYKNKLVAQCYDSGYMYGAHLDEIQRKIKEDAPQAVFVYCVEHRLSLILQQNFEGCFSSFFLSQFRVIYNLTFFFQRFLPDWPAESENLFKVVADKWDVLYNCLENQGRYEYEMIRLLEEMQEFEFAFLTCAFAEIFEVINSLYNVLKEQSLDIDACLEQIQNTCKIIEGMKQDETCQGLLESAKIKSKEDEPDFNKNKRMFHNILDSFLLELHVRFKDMSTLKFVSLTDPSKFEKYAVNFPSHLLQSLQEAFPNIFPRMERLKHELEVFYGETVYYNETIQSVIDILRVHNTHEHVFTEVYKLFCLVATLPSTYVENTFSFIQDIKTCAKRPSIEDDIDKNRYLTQHIGIQGNLIRELTDEEKETFYNKITDKFAALRQGVIDLI